ncbi:MAG: CpsD/CapB family tyrosine-protein kinase [Desulfobacterales bacterium]|nr:CpsD/CapB family tyrosine-protein kinase [Desulfobacterales bacterium]
MAQDSRKNRKGLSERIRDSAQATQANLDESARLVRLSEGKFPSGGKRESQAQTNGMSAGDQARKAYAAAQSSKRLDGSFSPDNLKSGTAQIEASTGKIHQAFDYAKNIKFTQRIKNFFSSNGHSRNAGIIGTVDRNALLRKAHGYAEVHRLRENIANALKEQNQKTVMALSAHDNSGNTFLMSVLAYNAASYSSARVLLADLNMRRPELHSYFKLPQEKGFTDIATGSLSLDDVIKDTALPQLKVVTAGKFNLELARFLNLSFLENIINQMKEKFDLVFIDTSPVLSQNRNNVDPTLLSLVCDKVFFVVQDKQTTKTALKTGFDAVTQGGGKVTGVVYNRQF